jgi:hypothetical protein
MYITSAVVVVTLSSLKRNISWLGRKLLYKELSKYIAFFPYYHIEERDGAYGNSFLT